MKRSKAPIFWPIQRKRQKYVVRPMPGPHSKNKCITTTILIRNILKYADSVAEVREIIKNNEFKVNGKRIKKYNFPIGLMDIIELEKEKYRVVPTKKGLDIVKTENTDILAKVTDKKKLKGNKTQLNLHSGSNILSEEKVSTGDVLVLDYSNKIKETIKLEKGTSVVITSGSNIGKIGKVIEIKEIRSSESNRVFLEIEGKKTEVPILSVFPIKNKQTVLGGDLDE